MDNIQGYKITMETEQTIKELEKSKDLIMQGDLNPERLSNAIVYMTGHLIRLGEFIAESVYQANQAYIYRKYKYAWEYSQLSDMTVTDKTNEATKKVKEDQQVEIEKRRTADRLKTLHEDYRLFIMVIQTRLSVIKSEMFYKESV